MFKPKFIEADGTFNNLLFVQILEKAKREQLKKNHPTFKRGFEITIFSSASAKEIWQFIHKLSSFLNSGIDIKMALTILTKQAKNPYLRKIINNIKGVAGNTCS